MEKITIEMTVQDAVSTMMAISNQMNNSRNMRMSFASSNGSKERVEILDNEIQSLAEVYKAIQEALG